VNVASLIASFATGTYTVTRTTRGTTTRGRIADGTTSTISITASVSPATGVDLMRLPEGRRTSYAVMVITATELLNGGQGAATEADTLVIDGETFEVSVIDPWRDPLSRAVGYKCIATVVH
jgi:hypothetical protein